MIIVSRPRRAGKTYELCEKAKKFGYRLMVFSETERRRIQEEHDLPREQILTLDDVFNNKHRGKDARQVLVDNADIILDTLLNSRVVAISVTSEEDSE
jgi:ribosome maturation protein Sdo1